MTSNINKKIKNTNKLQRENNRKNEQDYEFNPVEKNLFMSLEEILIRDDTSIAQQFSIQNIEKAILASGTHIDGRLSNLLPNQKGFKDDKRTYIALLSESTAVVNIFPSKKYASVYISTCGSPNPINSIEPFIYLFNPTKAKVRIFTSSSLDSIFKEYWTSNEEKFWREFDEEKVPYFYEVKNSERDKNGIYFDLINIRAKNVQSKISSSETNILVSMYEVDKKKITDFYETFSKENLEKIITENNKNRILGLMAKSFPSLGGQKEPYGFSYIAELENGAFATHITPEQKYISFYHSLFEEKIPYKIIKELFNLFSPGYSEIRIFGTSNIKHIATAKLPKDYTIRNIEEYSDEFYIDLLKKSNKKKEIQKIFK